MAARTHKLKHEIIEILRQGEASPRQIVEALGPEWRGEGARVYVRQMLGRMLRAHLLCRTGYGRYALSRSTELRGLDVRDLTVTSIEKFLRSCGGVARTCDIHEAVGCRQRGGVDRDFEHRKVTLALAESDKFRQDYGRGYWNLCESELAELPLMGRWADYNIQVGWSERGQRDDFVTWQDKRVNFFDRVGSAFMEVRGELDLMEVAADPAIAAALQLMGDAVPNVRADALDGLRRDIEDETQREGVTDPFAIAQRVRDRKTKELPAYLLAAFEFGDVALHLNATVELYFECARRYGVSAARLSRGEVSPELHSICTPLDL